MDRLSTSLLMLFNGLGASSPETLAMPRWLRHFAAQGVAGTFVLFEPFLDRYRVLDRTRAQQRFLPGATFDIAGALVALELGAIADEHTVLRWDGRPKPIAAWERDHTLATAMRDGVAWAFQEAARRTGKTLMREWLERLEYGNRDPSGGIELFWLQGGLRVSAMEQVRFLHRLSEGRLPMTQRAQRLVREALVVERTRGYTLRAKSALAGSGREAVAWWVGWIERKGRPQAYFAMNHASVRGAGPADPGAIGRAILHEAGVLQ